MNDEIPEQNPSPKNWNKRIIAAIASLAAAACAVVFLCKPGLLSSAVSAFSPDRSAEAAGFSSSRSVKQKAVSSAAPSSQAASSQVSLATAAAQVSLQQAARPLSIDVSISAQRVTVNDAKGRVVKQFVCSTGSPGNETPTGTFRIQRRGKSFYSEAAKEGGYYWTQFDGDFLFHSVPFDKNYKMEPEEAAKIGTPASHGCVRLELEDAKWIYDNIPRGTVVTIH